MKKCIYLRNFIFLFIAAAPLCLSAQQTKLYLGLGGLYNSYQDARFSNTHFNKLSFIPELGFTSISDKNYWSANAQFYAYNYNFPKADTILYATMTYNIRVGYARNVLPSFYTGINWDVIDFSKRQTSFLANGADSYKLSSTLFLSAKYLYTLNDNWKLNTGLDMGVFSFMNTEPSFSANYQQNIIDNGEVSFIDSETKDPYKLKNMDFKPFWQNVNIRTQVEIGYKQRLSVCYTWYMNTFSDHQNYPVTDARHLLTLRFAFINHIKK